MWNISAQQTDTTSIKKEKPLTTTEQLLKKHNPKVAIALSAVIPGSDRFITKNGGKFPHLCRIRSFVLFDL
jgi:hypothetical protein